MTQRHVVEGTMTCIVAMERKSFASSFKKCGKRQHHLLLQLVEVCLVQVLVFAPVDLRLVVDFLAPLAADVPPVGLGQALFLDTWLGTHASTMSRDVLDIHGDRADFCQWR